MLLLVVDLVAIFVLMEDILRHLSHLFAGVEHMVFVSIIISVF